MASSAEIGVGVIGLGFMGRTHIGCYASVARAGLPCRLVAVCDADETRLTGEVAVAGNLETGAKAERLFDPREVKGYREARGILADPRVKLVSICTHTDTHVDLAIAALEAGKHVLVEKPVALKSADVKRLAAAARKARTLCMPAMCIRFWPGWDWLYARVKDGSLGRVRSQRSRGWGAGRRGQASFIAMRPRAAGHGRSAHSRCGLCFRLLRETQGGEQCGRCAASDDAVSLRDRPGACGGGGSVGPGPGAKYRMHFLVNFEKASVEWDLYWKPRLRVFWPDRVEEVDVGEGAGYEPEVRHLVSRIAEGRRDLDATMDEAVVVAEMLEAERRSFETGETVKL